MTPTPPTSSPPPASSPSTDLPWPRASLLALGWTMAALVTTALFAGILNGLSLVQGQDLIVTIWTGIFVAFGALVVAQSVHRSWRVAMLVAIFWIPTALCTGFVVIVASYGQWAK